MLKTDEETGNLDNSWTHSDPSTLSYFSVKFYKQFEALLCPGSGHVTGCNCSTLEAYFGPRLFRCPYLVCQSQRMAFDTKSARDAHSRSHKRLFRCWISSCEFATIGFQSPGQLQKHWDQCHQNTTPRPVRQIENPSGDEIQPILFDLVSMGKINEVEMLWSYILTQPNGIKTSLITLAASTGSLEIVQRLLKSFESKHEEQYALKKVAMESVKGEYPEILLWAAPKLVGVGMGLKFHGAGIGSNSPEVFEIWKQHFSYSETYTLSDRNLKKSIIISRDLIREIKSPEQEIRLSAIWKERKSLTELSQENLGVMLKAVAKTNRSTVLAEALIKNGAPVDFKKSTGRTPLGHAAAKNSLAAAEFMKFLLLSGANPDASFFSSRGKGADRQRGERQLSAEPGPRNISKWLGMTWDELVKWTAEQRRQKGQNV